MPDTAGTVRVGEPYDRKHAEAAADVRTVCVDMTEALPVKLGNRGTTQAIGLVTDVGYFLGVLEGELR